MFDVILADLKGRFGAKVLLSPADIAEIIGCTTEEQANKRSKGTFPIPHSKDLGRVKISIYDLAKHIANNGKTQVRQELASIPDTLTRTQKKSMKGHLSKGWWLLRRTQIVSIITKSNLDYELNASSKKLKFQKI